MQLNRLLAGNPDKAANLRVVRTSRRNIRSCRRRISPSARPPPIAGEDAARDCGGPRAGARAAARTGSSAALLEAQVLQKKSPAEAAKSLGAFVEKNPNSREARLNYARVLVLDKRLPEARKQFEAVANASPGNPEVIYAVGLLAFQLKDYKAAEENMKRVLA